MQLTFQTVLVKPIISEDGETEEQAPGFKGAFFHGLERIAPDVEEAKGELIPRSVMLCSFQILHTRLGFSGRGSRDVSCIEIARTISSS